MKMTIGNVRVSIEFEREFIALPTAWKGATKVKKLGYFKRQVVKAICEKAEYHTDNGHSPKIAAILAIRKRFHFSLTEAKAYAEYYGGY